MSKLIVMLTHNDETVVNAKEVFDSCKDLPVDFWGFKDVGLPIDKMKELVKDMKEAGKTTFLEVVSLLEEEGLKGAEMAINCGFDYLLGTVYYPSIGKFCKEKNVKYLPFCGKVYGHPSILEGTPEEITASAKALKDAGCQGTDILAYRNPKDPEGCIKHICKNLDFPVVVAGSIGSFARIDVVQEINPWTFTIGSALFDGKFGDDKTFRGQLKAVSDYMMKKN